MLFVARVKEGRTNLLLEFNKNIRQATIRDLGELGSWRSEFGERGNNTGYL